MGAAIAAILGWIARIGPLLLSLVKWIKDSKWGVFLMFYLFSYMGGIIGQILKWLGISFVVSEYAMPELLPLIVQHLAGLPPTWAQFLALTKVDVAITVILSAAVVRAADQITVKRRRDAWQTPL